MKQKTMTVKAVLNSLWIDGEIVGSESGRYGKDDVCPSQFRAALEKIPDGETLELHINSPGGDVFAAVEMYNLLKKRGNVTVYVDGLAASAASIVAMAGDSIVMPANTYLMIHRASGGVWGNAKEMEKRAGLLREVDGTMRDIYAGKAKVSAEEIEAMLDAETWLTAQKAAEVFDCVQAVNAISVAARYDGELQDMGFTLPDGYREALRENEKQALLREVEKAELLSTLI